MTYSSFPPCFLSVTTQRSIYRIYTMILFTGLFLLPIQIAAQPMDSIEIAQKLQGTYEKATNLVADFNQLWKSSGTNQHRYDIYGQGRFGTNPQ